MYGAHQILGSGLIATPIIRCFPGMRGYQVTPDRAVGTSVTSGASGAYGTVTQVSTGLPYDAYIMGANLRQGGVAAAYMQLGLVLGLSGSLQTIAEIKLRAYVNFVSNAGLSFFAPVFWPYPIFVPAGTAISAKLACSASAIACNVSILTVPASEVRTLARMRHGGIGAAGEAWPDENAMPALRNFGSGRALGMVPGASLGVGAAVTGGTSPAYGSYATIIANLSADYIVTHLMIGNSSSSATSFSQVALGIGPAGSEYQISELLPSTLSSPTAVGEEVCTPITLPIGLLIPAGSRLAAKVACNNNAVTANIDVNGVYVNALSSELAAR